MAYRRRGGSRGRGGYGARQPVQVHRQDGAVPTIDTTVQMTEGKAFEGNLSTQTLSLESSLPRRPGYGTRGRSVILWANYFEVDFSKNLNLFRYSVDFIPAPDGKIPEGKKAEWCVQLLLEQCLPQFHANIVTDFKGSIISNVDLGLTNETFIIRNRNEGDDEPRSDARTYKLRVKATDGNAQLRLSDLISYVTSSNIGEAYGAKNEIIQALNIIMGHNLKTSNSVLSVGANQHHPISGPLVEKFTLGSGLEAFRGFFTSIRAATARVLLNVQVKHAACYEAIALDVMIEKFPHRSRQDLRQLETFLRTVRVQARHLNRRNPSAKSVVGLASPNDGPEPQHPPVVPGFGADADKVQFHLTTGTTSSSPGSRGARRGRGVSGGNRAGHSLPQRQPSSQAADGYISVAKYFEQHYRALSKPHLPVVNVGTTDGGTTTKLSPNQTAAMINFAVRQPHLNAKPIVTNGMRLIGADSNPPTKMFGISLSPELIAVPGRVLNGPTVRYQGSGTAQTRFGSWNMRDIKFSQSPSQTKPWSYIWISVRGQEDASSRRVELFARLQNILRRCGVQVSAPAHPGSTAHIQLHDGHLNVQAEEQIDSMFSRAAGKLAVMVVVLPKIDTEIYNHVKTLGDIRHGVHTICVVGPKFAKDTPDNNAQYLANVALKFNLKLGGANQSLETARLDIIGEGKTMVVGLDVTHPSPGSKSTAPSVAGIVASVDKFLGQRPADVRIQEARKEMIVDIDGMFKSALRRWQAKNKALPDNVLICRDGVSEGQYSTVLTDEWPRVRKACEQLYPAADTKKGLPRVSIIIVGKRHNTRFYATRTEDADRSGNPQNGTVVDRGVTEARCWDFFLQTHTALQGTARPGHYYVVLDEIFRQQKVKTPFENAADMLEDLTHNMCYMYGRATKAVSICPPAYYADLVCDRARRWLSKEFEASTAGSSIEGEEDGPEELNVTVHERLKDSMFYI